MLPISNKKCTFAGRKREIMRKSHKEELFNATFRLFILHGYDGVSLGDIEKATGMSRGAIFHYADSKLDLFRQVVEQYVLDRQSIDTKIRVGEDSSLREFIDAYIDGVKRTMTELMVCCCRSERSGKRTAICWIILR